MACPAGLPFFQHYYEREDMNELQAKSATCIEPEGLGREIETLSQAVINAKEAVALLLSTLDPIMRCTAQEEMNPCPPPAAETGSPFRSRVQDIRKDLQRMTEQIVAVQSRLDV